jgi:hypothetical protein
MPYNPPIMLAAGGIYAGVSDLLNYSKFSWTKRTR